MNTPIHASDADDRTTRAHPAHLLFVIVFVLFCLRGIAGSVYVAWFGWESRRWPSTEGELLSVQAWKTDNQAYTLSLRYRYEVDGVRHESMQFEIGTDNPEVRTRDERPEELAQPHLRVYYRPQVPSFSVLRRGIPRTNPLPFLAMVLFLAGAVWSVLFPRRFYELNDRLGQRW